MNDLQEAVNYIESCRDSHVDAIWWIENDSPPEDWFGDKDFHQDCVDGYNKVLVVLNDVRKNIGG